MSRSKTARTLPSLDQAARPFHGFPEGQTHHRFLFENLRATAESLRKPKAQVFYTMREVADFFGTSLRTVALVYQALEKEGVLTRIRSSHTLLAGNENMPRFSVRGIVGIPVWLEILVLSSFTRNLYMNLEERLRHRGFVADLIFHATKHEETHPDFSDRLLKHQLDIVIWDTPDPKSHQNILALRNYGVRILTIQTTEARTDFPVLAYVEDWRPAYRQLGRHWKAAGIGKVLIPIDSRRLAYNAELDIFRSIMEGSGLAVETCPSDPGEALRKCRPRAGGQRLKTAVAFLATLETEKFCSHEPLLMQKLAQCATLAFCRGPVRVPYLENRGVHVDTVTLSSTEMAAKLTEDIQILPLLPDGIRHTFEARFFPNYAVDGSADLS